MLPSLDTCTTWECINSFSSWFAAFGTILISGLALWLAWRDQLIRAKAYFDYGLIPGHDRNVLDKSVYILEFSNVGRRTVTFTSFSWKIRCWPLIWKYQKIVTFPHLEPDLGSLCSKFPIELEDGKSGHIFYKSDLFSTLDDKEKLLFSISKIIAFIRIFDFKIVLHTTVGKDIAVKIPHRVRKNIWKRYLKLKHNER